MALYDRIKTVCKENGTSINRLEQELGFARSSISKFDKNSPSIDKIISIANYLGITVDYLLGDMIIESDNNELRKHNIANNLTEYNAMLENSGVKTIAAHFDGKDFTEDELEDIVNYIEFVKSKKK